jgi:glycosyltransferase involved in cell wall biosynthesis
MISVFTPTHRNIYLRQAYESLKAQTYTDWEWVILANGGVTVPDFNDPRVKVFRTTETGMVGTLKKMACDLCTGDYLVEFDHDDELTPDCLEEISKCTEDFVYSNCFQVNNKWGSYYWGEGFGWEWRDHVYEPKNMVFAEAVSPKPLPSNLGRIWFAPNHVRAWKRSFYNRIGGHAAMKISDDHDLVARSYLEGTIKHIDKPLYIYRIHGENTWLQVTQEIQETMWDNYDKYFIPMQEKWTRDNDFKLVDLGGALNSPKGYESYDRHNADIVGDLNEDWNLEDNSVGLLRAHDIIEHLKDPIHTMNEAWRVLPHGGVLDILVPSTDGAGAWCDPTHVSFWNKRSFRYYTEASTRKYIEPECHCRFQVIKLENVMMYDDVPYVQAHLLAIKDDFRYHGELLI